MNNSKYDAVTVLYRRTIDKIKASPQEWQKFIKSVAYNYKLSLYFFQQNYVFVT